MTLTRAFSLGQFVIDRTDPRHVGVIISFPRVGVTEVRWEDSGWYSEVRTGDLEPAPQDEPSPGSRTVNDDGWGE